MTILEFLSRVSILELLSRRIKNTLLLGTMNIQLCKFRFKIELKLV